MSTKSYPGELKRGDKGDNIKAIQARLMVQETGEFGPTTEEKVKVFQGQSGLSQDGIVGPLTWAALFPSVSFREQIVARAKSYIGIKENPPGSNRGKKISEWQKLLGFDGQPWCAAFTYGICHEVAAALKVKNPLPVDGYCPTILQWAKSKSRITNNPQPGDVFLLKDPNYGAKHIGFFIRDNGDGNFSTVEGNAGDAVKALVRAKSTCIFVSTSAESLSSSAVAPIQTQKTGSDKIV